MPVYEFRCKDCGKVFDVVLMLSELEKAKPKCPNCGKKKAQRLLSAFTAQTSRKS